jgi:hypothetical protein
MLVFNQLFTFLKGAVRFPADGRLLTLHANVRLGWKWQWWTLLTNYDKALTTSVKGFIVHAPSVKIAEREKGESYQIIKLINFILNIPYE